MAHENVFNAIFSVLNSKRKQPDEFTIKEFISAMGSRGITFTRTSARDALAKLVEEGLLESRMANIFDEEGRYLTQARVYKYKGDDGEWTMNNF